MATKKENKTKTLSASAERAAVEAEFAVAEGPALGRDEARLRVLCALISSPRFSVKVESESVQDILVKTADSIVTKLGY